MEVVIVLSHLMNKDGTLGDESLKRVKKATSICVARNCSILVTSGWAYRKDNSLPIGKVVAEHIKKNFKLGKCKVMYDTKSRDTVGDAYFLRKKLSNIKYSKLTIITSDYHSNRAEIIFKSFYPSFIIEIIGIKTNLSSNKHILQKERQSLLKFKKTFKNVDINNDSEVYYVLKKFHPYYNGEIFSKI